MWQVPASGFMKWGSEEEDGPLDAGEDGAWEVAHPATFLRQMAYMSTSLIRNTPPPEGHHMALDIVLL